jgi:AbrB family looped-hinge helix DNA binding protein
MKDKQKAGLSCAPGAGCCRIESVVTVDERGQMVLPKEVRVRAGIEAGDRLAVIAPEHDGRTCCIMLIKADEFAARARELLGPLLSDIVK